VAGAYQSLKKEYLSIKLKKIFAEKKRERKSIKMMGTKNV